MAYHDINNFRDHNANEQNMEATRIEPFIKEKRQADHGDELAIHLLKEGLETLNKSKETIKRATTLNGVRIFVFTNFIIPALRDIKRVGEITANEASLVDEIVQHHLDDDLIRALRAEDIKIIESVLLPFVQGNVQEVPLVATGT